jgi:hypothetical protein
MFTMSFVAESGSEVYFSRATSLDDQCKSGQELANIRRAQRRSGCQPEFQDFKDEAQCLRLETYFFPLDRFLPPNVSIPFNSRSLILSKIYTFLLFSFLLDAHLFYFHINDLSVLALQV